jgi:hypothetical protein
MALYVVHYFWPKPYGPWSKAVHYKGNSVSFGTFPECFASLFHEHILTEFPEREGFVFAVLLHIYFTYHSPSLLLDRTDDRFSTLFPTNAWINQPSEDSPSEWTQTVLEWISLWVPSYFTCSFCCSQYYNYVSALDLYPVEIWTKRLEGMHY